MAFITVEGRRIYYRLEGDVGRPVLLLAHAAGLDHGMWAAQIPDWLQHLRVLRYDLPGHGASDGRFEDCSVADLGRDVLALADALGIGRFAFCGAEVGGAIGQWLSENAADRLTHLVTNVPMRQRAFTMAVLELLLGDDSGDTLAKGMAVRRQVLGDAHVDRAMARRTELNADFQELITRFAWGTVWSRPGLDHRTRRLLTLAITASLGRWEEFRLHVRTGLAAELEICDLKETLLHTAVYAGVPAANTAFQIVADIVSEMAP